MSGDDDIRTRRIRSGGGDFGGSLDDDAKTMRIASVKGTRDAESVANNSAASTPPIATLEPGHAVTRRIASPRRLPSPDRAIATTSEIELPVGWLTVVSGPGRGRFQAVYVGMNSIGRDDTNRIPIDFGDDAVSRKEHCFLTYDDESGDFWIQHGGKSNLVRLNDAPVLAPTRTKNGDCIRLGGTELRFTALCSDDFNWSMSS